MQDGHCPTISCVLQLDTSHCTIIILSVFTYGALCPEIMEELANALCSHSIELYSTRTVFLGVAQVWATFRSRVLIHMSPDQTSWPPPLLLTLHVHHSH